MHVTFGQCTLHLGNGRMASNSSHCCGRRPKQIGARSESDSVVVGTVREDIMCRINSEECLDISYAPAQRRGGQHQCDETCGIPGLAGNPADNVGRAGRVCEKCGRKEHCSRTGWRSGTSNCCRAQSSRTETPRVFLTDE